MNSLKYLFASVIILSVFSCKETNKYPNIKVMEYSGNLDSGTIKRIENFPSKFVRPRNVDIWLPDDYSEKEKYAVLYMHDGQMLFDAETTWNKQEWKVDEIVGKLIKEKKIKKTIVVAIWNHSDIRWTDYYPKKPYDLVPKKFRDSIQIEIKKELGEKFAGFQSDKYLRFIVEEVKPYIDDNFSVHTNFENTIVSGSSMGGLISMYAICEYPNVFGGVACISTHWPGIQPFEGNPVPESFFKYMEENLPSPKDHKIYFDFGTKTLDQYYPQYQDRVDEVLKERGFDESNAKNLKFEGKDHSENSWNQRFHIPLEFLIKRD